MTAVVALTGRRFTLDTPQIRFFPKIKTYSAYSDGITDTKTAWESAAANAQADIQGVGFEEAQAACIVSSSAAVMPSKVSCVDAVIELLPSQLARTGGNGFKVWKLFGAAVSTLTIKAELDIFHAPTSMVRQWSFLSLPFIFPNESTVLTNKACRTRRR